MLDTVDVDGNKSSQQILSKYKNILQSNGIAEEIADVIEKDTGVRGGGMTSHPLYVTVVFKNPKVKNLNLFVKTRTSNASHNELITDLKLFEKEAKFLVDYVAAARELCESKGREELLDIYPHCYYGDRDMIVMENLVLDKGYILIDKELRQNLDETQFAIRTLAKHHAIANAVVQNYGGGDKFLEKFPEFLLEHFTNQQCVNFVEPWMENGLKTVIKILENNIVEGQRESLEFLKAHIGKPFKALQKHLEYDPNTEKLLLLNHGDYQNNNMMFLKDKETGKTIGHKAIDLQGPRYNSPMTDMAFYLFSSVQTDVRQAHLHEFLDLYLDILKQTANDLGHPIDLTSEELFIMYRQKFQFGYWVGLLMMSSAYSAIQKGIDMNEVGDMNNFAEYFEKLIQKWITDNPEQGKEMAQDIVKVVNEFKMLVLE